MFQKQFSIISLNNVQNIRKNIYNIIICPIYYEIKAEKQLKKYIQMVLVTLKT